MYLVGFGIASPIFGPLSELNGRYVWVALADLLRLTQ